MRTKTAVLALLPLGLWAQMNGGLTGFGMMGQAMTGMGAFGPVVGPDGTAYALRQSVANTGMMGAATAAGTDLVAINPADGTARWTLRVNGYMLSEPILAPDGKIFLTDSEPGTMFDWTTGMWGPATRGDSSRKSRLIVIAATASSAHPGPGGD